MGLDVTVEVAISNIATDRQTEKPVNKRIDSFALVTEHSITLTQIFMTKVQIAAGKFVRKGKNLKWKLVEASSFKARWHEMKDKNKARYTARQSRTVGQGQ